MCDCVYLIDTQLRECTIMIATVDYDVGLSYRWREWREIVRVQPDACLGVNPSSSDILTEWTGCCTLAPAHTMRRVDEILAHNGIPDQSSFGLHIYPIIPFPSKMKV